MSRPPAAWEEADAWAAGTLAFAVLVALLLAVAIVLVVVVVLA